MGENDPHNFQVNLFLKKLKFPDGTKPRFSIGGNHNGGKILKPDKTGELKGRQRFNKKIQEKNNCERIPIGKNLYEIFEGVTVAFTSGNIEPFIPFSRDSEGGINSLFYNSSDHGEGDIFIDCGYTKFFLDMQKTGTSRYLQNIGGFIGSAERHSKNGIEPKKFRPKGVNFTLNKDPKLFFKYQTRPFDVIYLVDATGSMSFSIENVKNYCVEIANILKNQMVFYDFKFGAVFYRDPIDTSKEVSQDKNEYFDLISDPVELQNFVSTISASGGGDEPEDWAGGYNLALNKIHWRNGTKLIIHIADAGAHGLEYSNDNKYYEEGKKLDNYIRKCSEKNIIIVGFQIGFLPKQSFERVKMIYESLNNHNFKIQEFNQNIKDPGYFTELVVNSIINVT